MEIKMTTIFPERFTEAAVGGIIAKGTHTTSIFNSTIIIDFNLSQKQITWNQYYVGGLIGKNEQDNTTLSHIKTSGQIISTGHPVIGGLAGSINGEINNSSSSCSIISIFSGGLIGYASYASIYSSFFEGSIWIQNTTVGSFTGGLVGSCIQSYIENCTFTGKIVTEGEYEVSFIGGFIGGVSDKVTFLRSKSEGEILVPNGKEVGGYAGFANYAYFVNCSSTSKIKASVLGGGFIGNVNFIEVNISSFNGTMLGAGIYQGTYFGGIVGSNFNLGFIYHTSISGNINTNHKASCVGGIIGHGHQTTINNCNSTITINGAKSVGGLIGNSSNYAIFYQSFYDGNISSINETANNTGGLVGYSYGVMVSILSFSHGQILSKGINAGGIAGGVYNNSSHIFMYSYSTLSVSAQQFVGGLIGFNKAGENCNVTQCFSIGKIYCDSETGGGLIGGKNNPPKILDSYWDILKSGKETSNGGVGLSNTQMTQQSSFQNWNFEVIWKLDQGDKYPTLRGIS